MGRQGAGQAIAETGMPAEAPYIGNILPALLFSFCEGKEGRIGSVSKGFR